MFSDPIIQLGLFISAYIIVTGVCTYFGYSPAEYGLYMAFTAFMLSISMMLPDPIKFGVEVINSTVAAPTAATAANVANVAPAATNAIITRLTKLIEMVTLWLSSNLHGRSGNNASSTGLKEPLLVENNEVELITMPTNPYTPAKSFKSN